MYSVFLATKRYWNIIIALEKRTINSLFNTHWPFDPSILDTLLDVAI